MPKNSGSGFIIAMLCAVLAFATIWYIWWLCLLCLLAAVTVTIVHTFNYDRGYLIGSEEVARVEKMRVARD
jgi:cytochrome o ubiquinol oxidase subunit 1